MKGRRAILTALPVLAAAALIAVVFATGALDRQTTWDTLLDRELRFDRGLTLEAQDEQSYGPMNRGPGFDLPAGVYRLKWRVEADGENAIALSASNGAAFSPQRIALSPQEPQGEAYVTLERAADDVQIAVEFLSGTRIDVQEIRLYSPFYRDDAFSFALAAAGLCVLWIAYRRGALTPQRRGALAVIGFAVLLSSVPSLKDNLTLVYDTNFHMTRLQNLRDALTGGQFPARAGGYSYNGFGAVTSAMYPDVFLTPFALLLALGASIQYAMHLCEIAVNALAAWSMYVCAKRMFGKREIALCASALYTLAIYRITDVYVRCALGEALAMGMLPLFLCGLWETIFGDRSRWPLLAASASCICLCHLLSTALCGLFALGTAVLFAARIVREKRFAALAKAACLSALLCAFFLVPFLGYARDGIGAQNIRASSTMHGSAPAQMLLWGEGDRPVDPTDNFLSPMPTEIGLPLLLGALMLVYLYVSSRRDQQLRLAMTLCAAGALAALAATSLFPWGHLYALTGGAAGYIQFPNRLLMFTDALLAPAAACGYARFLRGRDGAATFAALALSALIALPTLGAQTRVDSYLPYGQGVSAMTGYGEYLLPGTQTAATRDPGVIAEGDVTLEDYQKDGTRITARVSAGGDARLSLPLFGFDGYAATLDGEPVAWTLGENNRLTLSLPAGTQGELRVWFKGKAIWRAADAVSLAAWGALAAHALRRRMKRRTRSETQGEMIS